jgi:hypothetical protein
MGLSVACITSNQWCEPAAGVAVRCLGDPGLDAEMMVPGITVQDHISIRLCVAWDQAQTGSYAYHFKASPPPGPLRTQSLLVSELQTGLGVAHACGPLACLLGSGGLTLFMRDYLSLAAPSREIQACGDLDLNGLGEG